MLRVQTGCALLLAAGVLLPPPAVSPAPAAPSEPQATASAGVVVELYTSQGCSSCPAADRVLSGLAGDPLVIPLAFHVDYWNSLGWTDPFSSPDWSERQRGYARRFRSRRVYTPQAVVNGSREGVGSNAGGLATMVAEARRRPPSAEVRLAADRFGNDFLTVALDAHLLEAPPARRLTAYLAVFESGIETRIERGENSGRTLRNDFVVRSLEPLFDLTSANPHHSAETKLVIDPAWRPEGLGVAAFLQDPDSLEIHAAARAELP